MYENWAKYDEVCRYYPFNPVDDIEIYRDKVKHWISKMCIRDSKEASLLTGKDWKPDKADSIRHQKVLFS